MPAAELPAAANDGRRVRGRVHGGMPPPRLSGGGMRTSSNNEVSISYNLVGTGWAECTIRVLDSQCNLRDLAHALCAELTRLETEVGAESYKQMWVRHDFPSNRPAELDQLLAQAPHPGGA